jgi:hypothetical protein
MLPWAVKIFKDPSEKGQRKRSGLVYVFTYSEECDKGGRDFSDDKAHGKIVTSTTQPPDGLCGKARALGRA